MKHFSIFDECWNAELHVIWPADDAAIHRFVKRKFKVTMDPTPENEREFSGRFVKILGKNNCEVAALIALEKWRGTPEDISSLAHELLHAVRWFLQDRGVNFTEETDEAYCYLLDSFLSRCLEKLNRAGR